MCAPHHCSHHPDVPDVHIETPGSSPYLLYRTLFVTYPSCPDTRFVNEPVARSSTSQVHPMPLSEFSIPPFPVVAVVTIKHNR